MHVNEVMCLNTYHFLLVLVTAALGTLLVAAVFDSFAVGLYFRSLCRRFVFEVVESDHLRMPFLDEVTGFPFQAHPISFFHINFLV